MKKGSYRFIIQRTTEILITVDDLDAFAQGEQEWEKKTEITYIPGSDYLSAIAFQVERDEIDTGTVPGARCKIDRDDVVFEKVRTCRHCGCTENDACYLNTGPCSWANNEAMSVDEDLCTNPFCIAARLAEAEKEVQP